MNTLETQVALGEDRRVSVNYKIFGGRPTAAPIGGVFANGWGCPPKTTEGPAEALADEGFTVVTFEPDPTARLTTRDRVTIMSRVGSFALDNYVAMGFGLGGDVATRVAYADYESGEFNVVGLIDVAGSHEESDRFFTGQVARVPEGAFLHSFILSVYLNMLASSESQSIRNYGAYVGRMSPLELSAYHFAACDSVKEAENGGSLDQLLLYGRPTYYIHGDGERATYLDDIRAQQHVQIVEIPNSGHFVYADAPEAYIGALANALAEINDR